MVSADQILQVLSVTAGDLVAEPPATGPGHWVGAPSAFWHKGVHWLAYRMRLPEELGRGRRTIIARSDDGIDFQTVSEVHADDFAAASLERPALVRLPEGGWRLYLSCATPDSKHWWVEAIDAKHPTDLPLGERHVVLAGDPTTEAFKDPVVWLDEHGQWQMWVCRHPLDAGPAAADRMTSHHATSADGLRWTFSGRRVLPSPGQWDERGARATAQVDGIVLYDGRASAQENFHERTGLAQPHADGTSTRLGGPVPAGATTALRYLSVLDTPRGTRLYWEAERPDGSNDLRTTLIDG